MKQIKKILVYAGPGDGADPALHHAAHLARLNGATVEVIDVVEQLPSYLRLKTLSNRGLTELLVSERQQQLEERIGPLPTDGLKISTRMLVGSPAVAITQHVLAGQHDLVLKTARPEGIAQRMWYGTVAQRLMRICPCPVWIIKPVETSRNGSIAAAIDPNGDDESQIQLNLKVVKLASELSGQLDSEFHLVHSWSPYAYRYLQETMTREELTQYLADCESAAREQLDRFLERADSLDKEPLVHLLKGDPCSVLINFADQHAVEHVVMGTVCRSGISGYLIGNTAEQILRHISTSVLAIKPDDFRSPVCVTQSSL